MLFQYVENGWCVLVKWNYIGFARWRGGCWKFEIHPDPDSGTISKRKLMSFPPSGETILNICSASVSYYHPPSHHPHQPHQYHIHYQCYHLHSLRWPAHPSTAVHSQLGKSFVLFCFFSSYSSCSRYVYVILSPSSSSSLSPVSSQLLLHSQLWKSFCPLLLMLPTRLSCFHEHSHHPLLLPTKLFWTWRRLFSLGLQIKGSSSFWYLLTHGERFQPMRVLVKHCTQLALNKNDCNSKSESDLKTKLDLFWTFSPFSSTILTHHILSMFWVLNILIILIPFLLHLLRIVDTKNSLLALGPRKQNKILFSSAAH